MVSIDERKATVLQAVVTDYIRTAEPVGSGRIARRYRLGVSPATIRHEMSLLEEMGFLSQPHTSAGRVPTDQGYRFYVDHLPRRGVLETTARQEIRSFFGGGAHDPDELLHGTASLLSKLTGYAAIALPPGPEGSRVLRAELVPVGSGVMLLVVGDTGRVDKRVLDLGTEPTERIVRRASELLSGRLAGLTYREAADRVAGLAREIAREERRLVAEVAEEIRRLPDSDAHHVHIGGMANIADEGSFERRETLRELVEALEERATVLELLDAASDAMGEVIVRIGHENPLRALNEASVVVAWYGADERPAGAVAVVGPTRMEYARAMSTAGAVAGRLSALLAGLAG
jgi:heat-inducible transcriptional repressor